MLPLPTSGRPLVPPAWKGRMGIPKGKETVGFVPFGLVGIGIVPTAHDQAPIPPSQEDLCFRGEEPPVKTAPAFGAP